jgi:aminoglycoside phosphotransferase (APT) family kinase protein
MNAEFHAVLEGLSRLAERLGWEVPTKLVRLSGGASQETWAFDCGANACVLRRAPGGVPIHTSTQGIGLATEAAVIAAAFRQGAPAPQVLAILMPEDGLGLGYVMARFAGETLARRIQRDEAFAAARTRFAHDAGQALARIHATPIDCLPPLPTALAHHQLELYEETFRGYGAVRPIFELGFATLRRGAPKRERLSLIHGDFRLGNLMVGHEGLSAVLDWELAHLGDPAEDLGWMCTPSWRFGAIENPVGGIGTISDLLAGYRSAGGDPAISESDVRFWATMGALKWGIMCLTMANVFKTGADPSVERAAIGRRSSETELDLILMLQDKL